MRHDVCEEGEAFRLRPVGLDDAAFIARLRSDPSLSQFIHATSPDPQLQVRWLEQYSHRPGDYYFIVERRVRLEGLETREGTVGIYDVNDAVGAAEWGRWVLRSGSLAAIESAVLVYRTGFERLGLNLMYCRTIADNRQVVQFHESFGLEYHTALPAKAEIGGQSFDLVEQRMTRAKWETLRPDLERRAARIARTVNR